MANLCGFCWSFDTIGAALNYDEFLLFRLKFWGTWRSRNHDNNRQFVFFLFKIWHFGADLNGDISVSFCSFGSNFGVLEEAETMTVIANFCSFCSTLDTIGAALNYEEFLLFWLKFWGTWRSRNRGNNRQFVFFLFMFWYYRSRFKLWRVFVISAQILGYLKKQKPWQ